ncbi:M14 family zinc carboxypeptidase [Bacteroidota bacterium]
MPHTDESPSAEAGEDLRIYAGETATLDGSGSKGSKLNAYWDFDDRDGIDQDAAGLMVEHRYKKEGVYIATLVMEDGHGNTSRDKKAIEVLTQPSEGLNITDNFEGGYIGQIYRQGNTYRCHLSKSLHWTARINNCENQSVTLQIYGFGKNMPVPLAITHYNDATFNEKFKAVYSHEYGTNNWKVLVDAKYKYIPDTETMEITAIFNQSPVYIGWAYIYTPYMLHRYISALPEKPFLKVEYIGKTVQGRDIPMVSIGDPDVKKDETVWLLGGQHGFEVGGISSAEGMIDFLISDDPAAVEARNKIDFKIFPQINPDAHANKWYRFNAHGIDLNRNWDQSDLGHGHDSKVSEPEVAAIKLEINKWMEGGNKRSIAIDIHDWTALKPGVQFSTDEELVVNNPKIRQFYYDIREKHLPHSFLYLAPAMGVVAEDYFHNMVPGNELSMTIEIGLAGLTRESDPVKIPPVHENVKNVGEQLVKMCMEYFNLYE